PLLAFFMLKEFEIRDIISILNGKKLGLKPAEIEKHLITWIN
ncbi:V-type ATPase subunit, partial [bacterium]|nr:V-type ATPase subunit [bacterium]